MTANVRKSILYAYQHKVNFAHPGTKFTDATSSCSFAGECLTRIGDAQNVEYRSREKMVALIGRISRQKTYYELVKQLSFIAGRYFAFLM